MKGLGTQLVETSTNNTTYLLEPSESKGGLGTVKSDGGSSSYYDIEIPDWLFDKILERNYSGNCFIKTEELIEVMGSDFDEANILKCLVRINSLKKGVGKAGNDISYDANKIIYSAGRLKERELHG